VKKKPKKKQLRIKGAQPRPIADEALGATSGGLALTDPYGGDEPIYTYEPPPPPPGIPYSIKAGGGFCSSGTSNRSQVLVRRRPR
jgi:hypothetical protein